MEIHQHREQIDKLRRKIEGTYYQVTQMAIGNRPRLQKLQLKVIMVMANKAMEEILNQTDLNITELNHLIYAAVTVITEEINGTETQMLKPLLWVRCIQGSIYDIRKDLLALIEVKRDSRTVKNIKRARFL
jgi:hypothetical protein